MNHRKGLLLVAVLALCAYSYFNSTAKKTDMDLNYSEAVEAFTENTEYVFDIDDMYADEESLDVSVWKRICYTYSPEGKLNEVIEYAGETDSGEVIRKYEYDKDGNLVRSYYRSSLQEEYVYKDGLCISEKYFDSNGTIVELHEYSYRNGQISSEYVENLAYPDVEDSDGNISETEVTEYHYLEYNAQGRLAKQTCYEYGSAPYIDEYTYSTNKVVAKSSSLSGDCFFVETTTYDNKGRVISVLWEFLDDGSTSETVYNYEDRQIVEKYYSSGEMLYYYVSGYDSDGYIVHQTSYSSENEIRRIVQFEYDEKRNIVKRTITRNDNITIQYAPERKYDDCGNLTEETYYYDVDYFYGDLQDLYKVHYEREG